MAWSPIPAPDRPNDDGITVDDGPTVIDDIEIIDEPRIIPDPEETDPEETMVVEQLAAPGPTAVESDTEDAAGIQAFFGPEMTAGVSVVVLFIIFAIVLTGGAPEQPRDQDETPIAEATSQDAPPVAPEVIEVEIGEPLVVERGE